MARLLVQSLTSGKFLCPSLSDGQPEWVVSLREAGGGVVADVESAYQLVRDWCDPDDAPTLIDLDRLGTFADYAPQADDDGGSLRRIPDGNHGDNNPPDPVRG